MPIKIHSKDDFAKMRKSGEIAANILDYITPYVMPGTTTNQLNDLCHNKILEFNSIPAPLNYNGFPKSICTSVNHVVCHGIPSDKILNQGDIINIDVTIIYDGWHGDTSRMFYVGDVSLKAKKLVKTTYECMMIGIEQVKPGVKFNEIGNAIENHANNNGFSVVRDYCGHGIGQVFHDQPNILHCKNNQSEIIKEGMFFTIEPMINCGKCETILSKHDGWTVTTRDKQLSAQFEHTIGVTKYGYEIFTKSRIGDNHPIFS